MFYKQLAWHPAKEGRLAFGTDDGRVGVFDTLCTKYVIHPVVFIVCHEIPTPTEYTFKGLKLSS